MCDNKFGRINRGSAELSNRQRNWRIDQVCTDQDFPDWTVQSIGFTLILILSFWKSNQTIVDDWTGRFSNLTAYPEFESLDYDKLFDPTKKTEPAEEYWL